MASFLERWLWPLVGLLLLLLFPWSLRLLSILLAAAVLALLLWCEYLWGMAASVCVCVCTGSSGTNKLLPAGPKSNGEGRSGGQLENSVRTVLLHLCKCSEKLLRQMWRSKCFSFSLLFPQSAWLQLNQTAAERNIWYYTHNDIKVWNGYMEHGQNSLWWLSWYTQSKLCEKR